MQRNSLISGAAAVAFGAVLTAAPAGLVRSQPAPPAPVPATAAVPAPVQPAAPPVLRDDQAQLLLKALDEVPTHGFRPGEFTPAGLGDLLRSRDRATHQRGEGLLRQAIVAYARAQHGGRLRPADFHDDWGIQPEPFDAAADFNFALSQDKLAEWLAALAPPFERYRGLRTALIQYRAIAARGGWQPISDGPALKPGMTDPRVVQLRQRLAAENAPGSIELTSPLYDPQFAAVVAAAQTRYGLNPDGVVGAGALKAFNVPVEMRMAEIALNMERWRWMPRAWPATRIEVNIAGAELAVFNDNKPAMAMKVVVGAPDKKTPMLRSEIHSVVFNPPWNVPSGIAAKELIPKGVAYLARKGFAWVSNGAGGSRLQQKPGPGNSLGRVKFDFNNPYGVYLHDTDAKTAFGRDARSISHGCVRVERPQDLANLLLTPDPGWSQARMDMLLADTTTVRTPLVQKMPVLLLYWTVFTAADGQVNFRDDEYKWDVDLEKLLKSGKVSA